MLMTWLMKVMTSLMMMDYVVISRDTTNAVCHAIEAALLHGLKGSSADKVRFIGTVFSCVLSPCIVMHGCYVLFCRNQLAAFDDVSEMKVVCYQ